MSLHLVLAIKLPGVWSSLQVVRTLTLCNFIHHVHPGFRRTNLSIQGISRLVSGAMSTIGLLQIFYMQLQFILFGYFASSNPSLPESSYRLFSPLHVWLPIRIQNGRFIQGSKNQLTPIKLISICHNVRLIIMILKKIWFAILSDV